MEDKRFSLDNIPKKPLQAVPDRYFEDLPQRIQARIHDQQKAEKVRILNWSPRRSWWSAGAAAVIGVLVYVTWPTRQESIGEEPLSQVATDDIIQYLSQQNVSLLDLSEHKRNQVFLDSLSSQPLYQLKTTDSDLIDQLPDEDISDLI